MALDISKVVSVDFNVVQTESSLSSYANTVDIYIGGDITTSRTYNSFDDATVVGADYASRQYDAYTYFTLGGRRLTCLHLSTTDGASAQSIYDALMDYKKSVSNTEYDFICVCISACNTLQSASNIQAFMELINSATAPNKLLVLNSTNDASDVDKESGLRDIHNLVYKYYSAVTVSGNEPTTTPTTCSAEFTIAAYLSQINLTQANSIRDYCFTDESAVINNTLYDKTLIPAGVSSSDYDEYKEYLNFTDQIGRQYVNFGGDTLIGTSIMAEWGAIASENAVVYAVLSTMLQKQYLTDGGLTNILASINNALSDYITNGFLETNTTYTGQTRYKTYGNQSYVLVANGQELPNGYVVVSIPMSRLTVQDRINKKFTPIFVFMQTMGGAREVEITGDILD